MKVLVTGANGQVGSELRQLAPHYSSCDVSFYNHTDLDICDDDAIANAWQQETPDVCINCAAYTAVDKAEEEPEKARAINGQAVEQLAKVCHEYGTSLIHFSTDYVFDGESNVPYQEEDVPNPQSVYGQTKLEGERSAFQQQASTLLIRTSWVYSAYGHNLVKTALRLAREKDQLAFVYDQIGAPTYAKDIAEAVLGIITKDQLADHPGIYHFSNPGVTSWYDVVSTIIRERNLNCHVQPILSKDYPTPAKRPHYSVLNTEKFRTTFDQEIPHWQTSLIQCLQDLE